MRLAAIVRVVWIQLLFGAVLFGAAAFGTIALGNADGNGPRPDEKKLGSGEMGSDVVAVVLFVFAAIVFPVIFLAVILKLRKLEAHPPDPELLEQLPADSPSPKGGATEPPDQSQ